MTTDWCFEYKVDQNRIISMHIYTLVYKDGNNEIGYISTISDFAWIALFQLNNAINSGLLYNNRNNENCLFLVKLCNVHKQVGDKMSGVYFKNNIVTDSLL